MSKPVYRMSEVGDCPRALIAPRLGYEPIPEKDSVNKDILLDHASECEALAAKQIIKAGYLLENGGVCQVCLNRFGNKRDGIHVELDTPLYSLYGHLDRRIFVNDKWYPVEIKSLGRFTWEKFARKGFDTYPSYIGQVLCYLEAEQSPGIYWVMNRDNGQSLKLVINDFKNELDLPGFEKINLAPTYKDIIDKLNDVEIAAQYEELIDGIKTDNCRWCQYRYLCFDMKEEEEAKEEITLPDLVEAAQMYKEGHEMSKTGEQMKEIGRLSLVSHAKNTDTPKFRTGGVSVRYRGQKTKTWLDNEVIKAHLDDEVIRLATRESAPYDDVSIRILKETKEE